MIVMFVYFRSIEVHPETTGGHLSLYSGPMPTITTRRSSTDLSISRSRMTNCLACSQKKVNVKCFQLVIEFFRTNNIVSISVEYYPPDLLQREHNFFTQKTCFSHMQLMFHYNHFIKDHFINIR